MDADEQAIRSLVSTWIEASAAGDLARVLELMDDDVVFLGPGRPPMTKDGFVAASRAMEGHVRIDGTAHIQEIRVFGDWAYCWNQLTMTMQPVSGGAATRRGGPALSILRKRPDGRWVIVRDANMVTTLDKPGE